MTAGMELARAAASLVGVRFRLHGRDPATGLDCVGLVSASLILIGRPPLSISGYSLRQRHTAGWTGAAQQAGFRQIAGQIEPGDVVLISPSPLQHHLMISETPDKVIHAHASLRRVVREPMIGCEPLALWRLE